jgi:hypothetical protein
MLKIGSKVRIVRGRASLRSRTYPVLQIITKGRRVTGVKLALGTRTVAPTSVEEVR